MPELKHSAPFTLVLLSLLAGVPGFTQTVKRDYVALGACPPPTNFEDVAKWVISVDRDTNTALQKSGKGDLRMDTGSVLDKSCLAGKNSAERDKLENLMQKGLARVAIQAGQCFRMFGFGELTSLVPVLRRARFTCEAQKKGVVASAETTKMTHHFFRRCEVTSGFSRQYEVAIDPATILDGEAHPDEFASTLFHELVHHLPTMNRSWHNDWNVLGRTSTGCDKSVFEDRVYLFEAACNPLSNLGREFYAKPAIAECAGNSVCRAGLDGADAETQATYSDVYGKQILVAKKYSDADSGIACSAIRDTKRRHQWLEEQQSGLGSRKWKLSNFIRSKLPASENAELKAGVSRLLDIAVEQGRQLHAKSAALKQMRKLQASIEALIQTNCQPKPKAKWTEVCQRYSASIAKELKFAIRFVTELREEDGQIQRFYNTP